MVERPEILKKAYAYMRLAAKFHKDGNVRQARRFHDEAERLFALYRSMKAREKEASEQARAERRAASAANRQRRADIAAANKRERQQKREAKAAEKAQRKARSMRKQRQWAAKRK